VKGDGVYAELADELRSMVAATTVEAAKPPRRFRVMRQSPLLIEELQGELVLEEGDPDFSVDERLKPGDHVETYCPAGVGHGVRNQGSLPEVGDIVIVEQDWHGDYIARGLVKGG
jgi:hypothetical protein